MNLDLSTVDQENFKVNFLEWQNSDKRKLLREKRIVVCCNCAQEHCGPSIYQKLGEEKYLCNICMGIVFQKITEKN